MSFYAAIADDYNAVTNAAGRRTTAERFLETLRGQRRITAALDVACGAGLYALTLAELGVRTVVGTDLELAMLSKAATAARARALEVHWLAADMSALAATLRLRFDLVLCLGNSLPHLLEPDKCVKAMASFRALLAPGAAVWIQTLNYDRILAQRERIVGIDREGPRCFIRFYDFLDNGLLRFNLLRSPAGKRRKVPYSLESTLLRPYRRRELLECLSAGGFRAVDVFGSFALEPFAPESSPTCLVRAVAEPSSK